MNQETKHSLQTAAIVLICAAVIGGVTVLLTDKAHYGWITALTWIAAMMYAGAAREIWEAFKAACDDKVAK